MGQKHSVIQIYRCCNLYKVVSFLAYPVWAVLILLEWLGNSGDSVTLGLLVTAPIFFGLLIIGGLLLIFSFVELYNRVTDPPAETGNPSVYLDIGFVLFLGEMIYYIHKLIATSQNF